VGGAIRISRRCLYQNYLPETIALAGCGRQNILNIITHIYLTVVQLLKQIGALPSAIFITVKERQLRMELKALEAERLDRIRNPSKYQGR
jgi:hypothetical protein